MEAVMEKLGLELGSGGPGQGSGRKEDILLRDKSLGEGSEAANSQAGLGAESRQSDQDLASDLTLWAARSL